jgi:hypothetical protein
MNTKQELDGFLVGATQVAGFLGRRVWGWGLYFGDKLSKAKHFCNGRGE